MTNPTVPPDSGRSDSTPLPRRQTPIVIAQARVVLVAFLFTFMAARMLVYLIMDHRLPDLYLHVGHNQTHVHHLNYGIFLLSFTGALLIFLRPQGWRLSFASALYGIGMGLTFDEFSMWYHLTPEYWQRGSFDAVVVIAGILGLIAVAPSLRRFRPHHWFTTVFMVIVIGFFCLGLSKTWKALNRASQGWGQKLHQLEQFGPKE